MSSIVTIGVVASVALAAVSGPRTDLRSVKSRYFKVVSSHFSTVTTTYRRIEEPGEPAVRPRINLNLSNKSKREFWLEMQLTPPPWQPAVTRLMYLDVRETAEFEFTLNSVLPDVDYALDLLVFADGEMSDTLESHAARLRFDRDVVEALDRLLAMRRQELVADSLPRAFENVELKDRIGLTGLILQGTESVGRLVVSEDGLEHIGDARNWVGSGTKKHTVRVAASQVRKISVGDVVEPCVVVRYDDGGKSKKLELRNRSGPKEVVDQIFASLKLMLEWELEGPEALRAEPSPEAAARARRAAVVWPEAPSGIVPICTADSAQRSPRVVADGADGAIIVWRDMRGGTPSVYAQHLLASGTVDPGWVPGGVALIGDEGRLGRGTHEAASDSARGAIVVWLDYRRPRYSEIPEIYAQHLLATGAVDPAWPSEGVAVCRAGGHKGGLRIVPDDAGGAIVVWADYRHGASNKHGGFQHLYAQHVLAGGAVDPDWPPDGLPLFPERDRKGRFTLRLYGGVAVVADGQGGAIVAWEDAGSQRDLDIYAQRVLSGGVDPAWPPEGRQVCRAKKDQRFPKICADGEGGAVVLWEDCRGTTLRDRIRGKSQCVDYVQHVMANGEIDPAWPRNGLRLPASTTRQITDDGAGGAIVAGYTPRDPSWWVGERPPGMGDSAEGSCLWVRHVLADGKLDPAWPAEGLAVCSQYIQRHSTMIADARGGAMLTWTEFPGPSPGALEDSLVIRSQHVAAAGRADPAWPKNGRILGICAGLWSYDVAAAGAGGFVVAFERTEEGASRRTTDVYAIRVPPTRERE